LRATLSIKIGHSLGATVQDNQRVQKLR